MRTQIHVPTHIKSGSRTFSILTIFLDHAIIKTEKKERKNKKMTAKELLMKLDNIGILNAMELDKNTVYVEDAESYGNFTYIHFDDNGNAIEIK